ncbi:MAG: hypothetical protein IKH84_05895, partial [Ottowia sp.]|nr:hypothetical protein [Ottowia sp.]
MPPPPVDARNTSTATLRETPVLGAVLNLRWQDDFVEVAVMGRDTLFVPASAQGLDAVWLRLRAQASISQWPVDAAHPVQARFVSRFGLRGDLLGERVPPSLLAGQVFWDGATVMAQDLDVAVPMGEPMLELHGSAGYNASHGPGLRLQAAVNDMARLGRVAGLANMGLAGSVRLTADMSRGGEHAGWWAKPLEQPPSLVANPLPGFALLLPDKGGAPQVRDLPAAVAGARASQSPTALHAAIGLEVPSLTLPQGTIEGVKLSLEASSADAETAPKGTTSRKADAQAGSQAAQGEASNTPSGQVDADFTALGLPKAIVGRCDLAIASLLGMGDAAFGARWLAAGWPGEADVFQVQLDDLRLKFPGGSLKGDMGLAYALPVRRMWPWLDGAISVNIDNWNTISRLASTPIRGEGVGVDVALESLYDPQGRARQYLKAQFRAGRVSTPDFAVSALAGRAESQHVHALADAVSLAANPGRQGSTSPEPEPTADLSLLDASISMGAGAGGPLNWKTGSCAVRVAGEQGTFNAQLQGALDASVSGSYDFRQRLLKV